LKKRLLGVIDATTIHREFDELIVERALAAVPFAGRYRLVDFILSSMVNSGVKSVAIFPKFQYRSLADHLGSGRNWDLNRKRDGLFLFAPQMAENQESQIGSFDYFSAHMEFFYRSTQEYALVTNCYTVANIDFRSILTSHIETGCDITEIRHEGKSLEMYILKTSLLIELLEKREMTGYTCIRDVVESLQHGGKLCYHHYKGYAEMIDSVKKYYLASMDLLDPDIWKSLFLKEQPIYTKVMDEPPTRYSQGAKIQNSMIANGCQIEGTVENCIIARGVKIGKNTVVRNSVILQKCQIADHCQLENVIIDKDVMIESGRINKASFDSPIVIRNRPFQGALMNS
jgi:glucose-1-phosphate adenylyltransferase